MAPVIRGRDFIHAVFAPCDQSGLFIDVRFLGPQVHQRFVPADEILEIGKLCEAYRTFHAFFGVALRDGSGGDLQHCRQIGVLHVDLDGRLDAKRLAQCLLAPSIIVNSGGGFHLYWLLREPLTLPLEADRTKNLDRRLARWMGGDLASAEPARILRLPGTKNWKYQPCRAVNIHQFHPDRRYNPSDFDEWLPPDTVTSHTGMPWSLSEKMRPGDRNNTLYRVVRTLMLKDIPPSVIATVVRTVNAEHSTLPLDEHELRTLMEHALRQPNRPASRHITIEVPA